MARRFLTSMAAGIAGVALATAALRASGHANPTTAALLFLLTVLLVAATGTLTAAIVTSFAATLCLNYFFLPPVGTWHIAEPQNWIALGALVVTSVIASQLSVRARLRAEEAGERRRELARLFDLSRDVLMTGDQPDLMAALARHISRRFDVDPLALAFPDASAGWQINEGGAGPAAPSASSLDRALVSARAAVDPRAPAPHHASRLAAADAAPDLDLVPIRLGTGPVGILAAPRGRLEPGTLAAIAGIAAIAYERSHLMQERRSAERATERAELASALLAAMGHDLRTPLTALRVAVENLSSSALDEGARRAQADLAARQAERLTRVFDAILDMARIESGAVQAVREWCAVSDILSAAVSQSAPALEGHRLHVHAEPDLEAFVDPRLTASALSHLLENAARYSPRGSTIDLRGEADDEGLRLSLTDEGPGLDADDMAHLFEPLFRGRAGRASGTGTGMGLAITRGLLTAEGGRTWAENRADRGTRFTIAVPAATRTVAAPEPV